MDTTFLFPTRTSLLNSRIVHPTASFAVSVLHPKLIWSFSKPASRRPSPFQLMATLTWMPATASYLLPVPSCGHCSLCFTQHPVTDPAEARTWGLICLCPLRNPSLQFHCSHNPANMDTSTSVVCFFSSAIHIQPLFFLHFVSPKRSVEVSNPSVP